MGKLKDKNFVGMLAAGLMVVWILIQLLCAVIGLIGGIPNIFDRGFLGFLGEVYSYIGGLVSVFDWLLMLAVAVSVAGLSFAKDKFDEKKHNLFKVVIPVAFWIMAVGILWTCARQLDAVFDVIEYRGVAASLIFFARTFGTALVVIAHFVMAALTTKEVAPDGKKKLLYYAPAILTLAGAIVTIVASFISILMKTYMSGSFISLFTGLISNIALVAAFAAVAHWFSLPKADSADVVSE